MAKYAAKQPDKNGHVEFTAQENETWSTLIKRQNKVIQHRACQEFVVGVEKIGFSKECVPSLDEVSKGLACTQWSVKPVTAMIPLKTFFELIANRKFPVATFIRAPEELDYLKEPDIFHEYFGHCPLLTLPAYADFVAWYGQFALTMPEAQLPILGRLFWFTIEFGLIQAQDGLRIMGGGILSSHAETQFCLDSDEPERVPFDLETVLKTDYHYWEMQKRYFVLRDFEQLYELQDDRKLRKTIEKIKADDATVFRTC